MFRLAVSAIHRRTVTHITCCPSPIMQRVTSYRIRSFNPSTTLNIGRFFSSHTKDDPKNSVPSRVSNSSVKKSESQEKATGLTATLSKDAYRPPLAGDFVATDYGVRKYLQRVYFATGASVTGSIAISYAANLFVPAAAIEASTLPLVIGGTVGAIGCIVWFFGSSYKVMWRTLSAQHSNKTQHASLSVSTMTEQDSSIEAAPRHDSVAFRAVNSTSRQLAFVSFVACESLVIMPAISAAMVLHGGLVPAALAMTTVVMGGSWLFAMRKPLGSLEHWSGPLCAGLIGMIGMSLVGIGAHLAVGPNLFSNALFTVEPYIGVGIFTAFTAYDTHHAITQYQSGHPDHLEAALNFYLDAVNLFVRILEILSRFYRK